MGGYSFPLPVAENLCSVISVGVTAVGVHDALQDQVKQCPSVSLGDFNTGHFFKKRRNSEEVIGLNTELASAISSQSKFQPAITEYGTNGDKECKPQ